MRAALLTAMLPLACYRHYEPPSVPAGAPCACEAHAPKALNTKLLCTDWRAATGSASHHSYPELDARSCFVRVRYPHAKPDPIPDGCGYPETNTHAAVASEIVRYDTIAAGQPTSLPFDLACALPTEERTRAAKVNANTLRATIERTRSKRYPYAAVSTFGFGSKQQEESGLLDWRPGDACRELTVEQMHRLGPNVLRAGRAAEAFHHRVAPVVTVSGGAVHSRVYEAWLLAHLLTCKFKVPADAILVDPCADHTHVNVRNTAGLVVALGGHATYVVTDGLQGAYMQEWTYFDLFGGSIDQRSMRDFGYIVGSFRQASVGEPFGFWLTPYRYWAEPREGAGGLTCSR